LQGLPVNKRELLLALGISVLVILLPLMSWGMFFWGEIASYLKDMKFNENPNIYKIFINFSLIILFFAFSNIGYVIKFPRVEYQNKKGRNIFGLAVRNFLIVLNVILYSIVLDYFLKEQVGFSFWPYLVAGFEWGIKLIISWWGTIVLLVAILWSYQSTLIIWLDEKSSYTKPELKSHRLLWGQNIVLGILLLFPLSQEDYKIPSYYQGNELSKAVYNKNYEQVDKLINQKSDINEKNLSGFTPMFVAIREGDLAMVKYLEKRGANFAGTTSTKLDHHRGHDALMLAIDSKNMEVVQHILSRNFDLNKKNLATGYYPIHLASALCDAKVLDFLISNGANVNVLTNNGETPLIVAAKFNCFSSAVSLVEAGVDFAVVDTRGNKATDYLGPSSNKEFKYFLEKHSRVPASK
jgi:ankyrin repeat protein